MKRLVVALNLIASVIANAQSYPDEDYFNRHVVAKVIAYNKECNRLVSLYKAAREIQAPDTAELKTQQVATFKKCLSVPQEFITTYPSSPFCIDALMMLGDASSASSPVQLADLERLFSCLDPEIKNSSEGRIYASRLKSYFWLNELRKAASDPCMKSISFKQAEQELVDMTTSKTAINSVVPLIQAQTENQLLKQLKASTLIINMAYLKQNKLEVNPATAYVIDENGICVTNYHVIKEYSSKNIYTSLSVMTHEGGSYPVTKVLACSAINDLAIVQVDTKGDKLTPLPLGEYTNAGDAVYVLSHPIQGYPNKSVTQHFYTLTKGAAQQTRVDKLFGDPCIVLTITADFTQGSSGAPVVDKFGNLIGTVSRLNGNDKITIPVSLLKDMTTSKSNIK